MKKTWTAKKIVYTAVLAAPVLYAALSPALRRAGQLEKPRA